MSETAPHPATNRPHSIEHRSVEEELTVSSSQDHRDKAGENGIPDEYNMGFGEEDSGMELDSRANMAVVGRHALIISNTLQKAQASSFKPEYEEFQNVPIVDAAIYYTYMYNDKLHILIVKGALIILSINKSNTTIHRERGRGARELHFSIHTIG